MIQFSIDSKGRNRPKAVLKTLQVTQRFDLKPDENNMVDVLIPCQLFEDKECRKGGLSNSLEPKNYTVKLPKKVVDAYNKGCYDALMKHPDIKNGIKV